MQVDRHLDTTCPGESPPYPKTTSSSIALPVTKSAIPKAPERLPLLSYSMLNDTVLRKKVSQLGLSTFGSRQLLERRHKEYVTLWNANCDSAQPKSKFELMRDLQVWERTLGGQAPTLSRAANLGAQIKDKDFDGAAWAVQHDSSFKDLIANARKSRLRATQSPPEPAVSQKFNEGSEATSLSVLTRQSWTVEPEALDPIGPDSSSPRLQTINGETGGQVFQGGTEVGKGAVGGMEITQHLAKEPLGVHDSGGADGGHES